MSSNPMAAPFQPLLLPELSGRARRKGAALPTGFSYQRDLISAEEEAALIAEIAKLPLKKFAFHGYEGNRRVFPFGYRYDYTRRAVDHSGISRTGARASRRICGPRRQRLPSDSG
jgi:hypothetical protein